VVVLERGEAPGGMAASFEVDGVRVDHGSHRLHPSIEPRILADLQALLGGDLQRRIRNGRIRLAGRWIRFPLRPADLARGLPPSFALGAAGDALTGPVRKRRKGQDTFADVLLAGLGRTMCERFYFPYARKLWGLEPGELDGEQARRRVSASSPGRLLRRVALGARPEAAYFWYPRGGYGQIVDRLAQAAQAEGADLRLGQAVTEVRLDGRVRVTSAAGEVVEAPRVWSTIPLPALARITSPRADTDVLAAAGALEFRAMLLVYLALDGRPYTPFDAHYLPEPATPVSRISEPANYRDGDDPPERTVLCAEIPCTRGDALWDEPDHALGELVADTLRRVGLPEPKVRAVHVRRLPNVYPVYRVGYARPLGALDDWAAAQPGLLTFGRQGLFVHDNTHHALAMAWAAADALGAGASFDERAWAAARARFATHVVED
jgi:protoporphyrinogen oxidase